jgi:hypothetical protein
MVNPVRRPKEIPPAVKVNLNGMIFLIFFHLLIGCGTLNVVDSSDADNWIGGLSL